MKYFIGKKKVILYQNVFTVLGHVEYFCKISDID